MSQPPTDRQKCPSRKVKRSEINARRTARETHRYHYKCDLCDWWHLTRMHPRDYAALVAPWQAQLTQCAHRPSWPAQAAEMEAETKRRAAAAAPLKRQRARQAKARRKLEQQSFEAQVHRVLWTELQRGRDQPFEVQMTLFLGSLLARAET